MATRWHKSAAHWEQPGQGLSLRIVCSKGCHKGMQSDMFKSQILHYIYASVSSTLITA